MQRHWKLDIKKMVCQLYPLYTHLQIGELVPYSMHSGNTDPALGNDRYLDRQVWVGSDLFFLIPVER